MPTNVMYTDQVMLCLGISRTTLLRFLREKKLEFRRDVKNRYLFDEAEVHAFREKYFQKRPQRLRKYKKKDDDETARECFRYFQAGHDVRTTVIDLGVHPKKVDELYAWWRENSLGSSKPKTDPVLAQKQRVVEQQIKLEELRLQRARVTNKKRTKERRAAGLNVPDEEFGIDEP